VAVSDRAKCIKQPVLSAARNAKFLLSRLKASQSFAEIAIERRKDYKFLILISFLFFKEPLGVVLNAQNFPAINKHVGNMPPITDGGRKIPTF